MPVVDGREYRAVSLFNAVPLDNDGGYVVEGYATTFDQPYDLGRSGTKEMIRSTALAGADMSDVVFQYNHEGMVMARQRNGSLNITLDDHGLKVRASLGGSQEGRSLYEAINNGLIDRMSWAFSVAKDGWSYDETTRMAVVEKVDKVYDVSAVSFPANEGTEIKARSYIDGVIDDIEQQELLQRTADERKRLACLLEGLFICE